MNKLIVQLLEARDAEVLERGRGGERKGGRPEGKGRGRPGEKRDGRGGPGGKRPGDKRPGGKAPGGRRALSAQGGPIHTRGDEEVAEILAGAFRRAAKEEPETAAESLQQISRGKVLDVTVEGNLPVIAILSDSIGNGDTSTPDTNRR